MRAGKRFLSKIVYTFFYPCKVVGKENIPDGGVILACNHYSYIDPLYVVKGYNKDIYFVGKKELFAKKWKARFFKSLNCISLDRDNPEMRSLIEITKVLKGNHKLFIAPEGTRNKTGKKEMLPFKSGCPVLSVKSKCPIVPIIIKNKAKIFRRNFVVFGEPIFFNDFYDKELTQEVIEKLDGILRDKMVDLQTKVLSGYYDKKVKENFDCFKR